MELSSHLVIVRIVYYLKVIGRSDAKTKKLKREEQLEQITKDKVDV